MTTEPFQNLIDNLSAAVLRGFITQTLAMVLIADVRSSICPICGDKTLSSYQVVVSPNHIPLELDFFHGAFLPCHLTLLEMAQQ